MTASTLTAEAAAGDLLHELRDLLDRHDGASSLDDARALADDLTTALRRARGRITRLRRKTAEPEPAPAAPAQKLEPAAAKPAQAKPEPAAAAPASAEATTRIVATRPSRGRRVLAVAAVVWSVVAVGASAVRAAVRRMLAWFASDKECIVCGPDDACCRPVMPLPRADDAPSAVPDLNAEQAVGLACIECGIDFFTTRTLKVPAGVADSTGDTVFACVGECAARHADAEPAGEQMELLS